MIGRAALSSVVTLLGACGIDTAGPPEIALGMEECAHCRMIISEEAHSAAAVAADGTSWKFDDLGCLLAAREEWNREGAGVWVHDVESTEWIDARSAFFLRQDAATTPMGSGLVALATEERARRRAADGESIYDWQELVSLGAALEQEKEMRR